MGDTRRTMGIVFGSIDVEQASYTVEATMHQPPLGTIEVRKYHSALAAQVDSRSSSEDQAFKNLARYIGVFGTPENQGAGTAPETVAMTAPVVNSHETMQFILPAGLTLDTAPKPTNQAVTLVELPERTYAVLRYSGSTDLTDAANRVAELVRAVGQNEADPQLDENDWQLYRYNPPFTLPWLRTNEIAVRVLQ